jgi:hypothetical protein
VRKYVPIARPRVARFTRAIPQSAPAVFHVLDTKIRSSKFHHGPKLWASQNIFGGRITFDFWPNMAISWAKPYGGGPQRRPGRHAHGGTALAPRQHVRCPWDFLGLVNTSRTSLVRNNERYLAFPPAVPRAFLEVSDLRTQFGSFYL